MEHISVKRTAVITLSDFATPLFVIENEHGEYIAQAQVALSVNEHGVHGHVEDVHVNVAYRGRGYAKCILDEIVVWTRENNLYKLTLTCKPQLMSLYEKWGFVNRSPHDSSSLRLIFT